MTASTTSLRICSGDLHPCQTYVIPVFTFRRTLDERLRKLAMVSGISSRQSSPESSPLRVYRRHGPGVFVDSSSRLPMWTIMCPSNRLRKQGGSLPWTTRTYKQQECNISKWWSISRHNFCTNMGHSFDFIDTLLLNNSNSSGKIFPHNEY